MALISLGFIDKKCIPILIGSISCFFNRLLNNYDGSLLFKNPILTNINISSCKLFAIIPLIILKTRSKKIHESEIKNNINENNNDFSNNNGNHLEIINKNETKLIIKGKLKFILLSVIVFFFNQLFFVLTIKVKSNTTILNILITSIFYYCIFKIKLYRHHYLSVILIIITGFAIDIILDNYQYDIKNNLAILFIRLIREILYSLSSVIDKYIMEKKYVSVYEILSAHGILTLLLFIIIAILDYNFWGIDNYEEYFSNFNSTELLVIFGVLITQFGLNLFILITNRDNSPCHIFIIFVFGQLAYYVDFSGTSIIVICCLIFILFLSLIFNEIIEINFLGLSFNTKKNIILRAKKETVEEMIMTKDDSVNTSIEGIDKIILKDDSLIPKIFEENSAAYD